MTPEHRAQMRRLRRFRASARVASNGTAPAGTSTPPSTSIRRTSRAAQTDEENDGEREREDGNGRDECDGSDGSDAVIETRRNQLQDPLIFSGVYAPSGIDMMKILVGFREFSNVILSDPDPIKIYPVQDLAPTLQHLDLYFRSGVTDNLCTPNLLIVRVRLRPNPTFDLGRVDDSCALILCDLHVPDTPIVYSSEAFCFLTGYDSSEVLGRNCRFLQAPDGNVSPGDKRLHTDEKTVYELKTKIQKREEAQTSLINYKKGGERFENILTTIPLRWDSDSDEIRYVVGFQVDREKCFTEPAR